MRTPATDTFAGFATWPAMRTIETRADCCTAGVSVSASERAQPAAATKPTAVISAAPLAVNSKTVLMLILWVGGPGHSEHPRCCRQAADPALTAHAPIGADWINVVA